MAIEVIRDQIALNISPNILIEEINKLIRSLLKKKSFRAKWYIK